MRVDGLGEDADWTVEFETVLLTEGEVTPGGWMVQPGATKMPERLPLSLRDFRGNIVGRVDTVWRDGNQILARGVREACAADMEGDGAAGSMAYSVEGRIIASGDDLVHVALTGVMVAAPSLVARPPE